MLKPDLDVAAQQSAESFVWEPFARLSDRLAEVAAGSGEGWLLSGPEGAGKTTLLDNTLPRLVHPARRIVRVAVRHADQLDLSGFAARVLGGALVRDPPTSDDLDGLTAFLAAPAHGATLLVVDGAHAMRAEVARYIQFAWASAPDLQIVFAGRSGFRDLIDRTEFAYLRSRLGPELAMPRLSDAEAERYIAHRLRLVGASADRLLAEGAMDALVREGQGLPGRINKLGEIGIEIGVMRAERRLTPVSVLQAASRVSRPQRDIADVPAERVTFGRAPPSGNALMVIPQAAPARQAPPPPPLVLSPPEAARPPGRNRRAAVLVALAALVCAGGVAVYAARLRAHPPVLAETVPAASMSAVSVAPIVASEPSRDSPATEPPPSADPPAVSLAGPAPPPTAASEVEAARPPDPVQAVVAPPTPAAKADEAALAQARAAYFKQAAEFGDPAAQRQVASPTEAGAPSP